MSGRPTLAAAIITYNEEENIQDCLDSVTDFVDEIVVLDSISTDATKEILMLEGFNTDVYIAEGDTRLAQQWTTLHFGDYVSYYLAMAYEVDPSPVPAIEELKVRLRQ